MKRIFKFLSFVALSSLLSVSCSKDVDLMTDGAKEGGLIHTTSNLAYKIGDETPMNVNVEIPKGPAISKILVNKVYTSVDGAMSNVALLKEVMVDGANAQLPDDGKSTYTTDFTINYDEVSSGLTVGGTDLSDPYNLQIGDKFVLLYNVVMEDGSEYVSIDKTNMSVANAYEGEYLYSVDYYHPTAAPVDDYSVPYSSYTDEEMYVSSVTSTVCEVGYGVWWDSYWLRFEIDPETNLVVAIEEDPNWGAGTYLATSSTPTITDQVSHRDPDTGNIYLYYAYDGGSSNSAGQPQRVFHVVLKPVQ